MDIEVFIDIFEKQKSRALFYQCAAFFIDFQ